MKRTVIAALLIVTIVGCFDHAYFEGPDQFDEDFEAYHSVDDMFVDDDVLWSFTQLTMPENTLIIDSTFSHGGLKSIKCFAQAGAEGTVSKASFSKQNMAFWEGETMRASGWYYIPGDNELDWLFIMDLEEQTAIGAGPGIRLAIVDNCLMVEHKYLEDDIYQPTTSQVPFPRNEWVYLNWEVYLSTKDDGTIKLYQNGELILSNNHTVTLPQDILYFQQGTKGMYSSIEFGATANPTGADAIVWVDDIFVEVVK
ncbi:MAG TPA: hypothetical protein PKK72_12515 [Chitinophagales bacterium]|nr:hypothetical protein [Chitinophagales bacterium]HNM09402.1 hypothetical protein [Chitinophagales bacterium]HNM30719.1 hypothetical protein [Chitinophagales bacterium]